MKIGEPGKVMMMKKRMRLVTIPLKTEVVYKVKQRFPEATTASG